MKFLLDNALSPAVAEALRAEGHDAVHVRDHGLSKAPDDAVFEFAASQGRVLVSQDTDFGTLLARRNATKPSVILLRRTDKRPATLIECLLANLGQIADHLAHGSVVVIEDNRVRVRRLPFASPSL